MMNDVKVILAAIIMFGLWVIAYQMAPEEKATECPRMKTEVSAPTKEAKVDATGQILTKNRVVEAPKEAKVASYYDYTLSGMAWSKNHRTMASRDFPRYSTVRVTNLANGKSVDVFVNDFGPETCEQRIKHGLDTKEKCVERHADLSSYAFSQIADLKLGLIKIKMEKL